MNRTVYAIATVAVAAVLAGCGGEPVDDQPGDPAGDVATTVATTAPTASSTPGMDSHPLPEPTPMAGTGEDAIEAAVEKFALNFACYRTFAQQPQKEWFDSWSDLATDELVQRQRVAFSSTWAWTWNTETQAIGCQRDGDMRVADTGDGTAVARISVERHLYHADDRANEGEAETKTYDVAVDTDDDRIPTVTGVAEVADDAPFPPDVRSLGR